MKNFMQKTYNLLFEFDLKKQLSRLLSLSNRPFWLSFATTFLILNIIFLFHSKNFMFGDHDWKYLSNDVGLDAGLFEGRFTQFVLINLLASGRLLPVINNTIGFAGFSLGLSLLAHYWRLPHKTATYVIFCLFTAITPYILSFMYFAFLVIACLSWNAVIIGALIISEKERLRSLWRTIPAVFLITFAFGGYPPVINLISVALAARIAIAVLYENATIKSIIKNYTFTVLNILLAAVLYKYCLQRLTAAGYLNTSYYNLQTTPLAEWGSKFLLVSKDMILQFFVTLPFITTPYKLTAGLVVIFGILSIAYFLYTQTKNTRRTLATLTIIALFYAPLITLFISTSLAETEFSPRIDFFGLLYFYAAMLVISLKSPVKLLNNIAVTAAVCSIFTGALLLFEAQKVWKLGFDTELGLYKRISKRFEQHPNFDFNKKYIMVQGASPSFRHRFYNTPYTHKSDDLLSISYVPGLNPGVMWNYYGQNDYADDTAYVYTFQPDEASQQFLLHAKPWPAEESTAVGDYWIMVVLSAEGLYSLQQNYLLPQQLY